MKNALIFAAVISLMSGAAMAQDDSAARSTSACDAVPATVDSDDNQRTKTGHVTLMKRCDDSSVDQLSTQDTVTGGPIRPIIRSGSSPVIRRAPSVVNAQDMAIKTKGTGSQERWPAQDSTAHSTSACDAMPATVDSESTKKEFVGHVTLLKRCADGVHLTGSGSPAPVVNAQDMAINEKGVPKK